VGAKLAGFDQSVKITNAPTIVCEGDEYLASALLRQPKFHFLFPHVAILTGIAWDHINVFPTFEFYLEQFVIFMNKIEAGGLLIYNETDEELNKLVLSNKRDNIRYIPYKVPAHQITNGQTYVTIDGAEGPLSVFGDHNLLNMQAAYYACAELGIAAKDFVHAMANFTGASKRLELLANNAHCNIYRDFAHAPSKVIATIEAVKQQFPSRKLIGVLELHTYSSLNKEFMHQYKGALEKTDTAVVFYSKHALQIKGLPELPESYVVEGFDKNGLLVMTDKNELEQWLRVQDYSNTNLVLMSSGNYDGIDLPSFAPTLM
jgi:UDP-N-acetylmuramate: L-alanyl-gamma-D-glutamyl-meso-diaminopimelate ligase